MIRIATNKTSPLVRQMWKTCFEDSDEFMDMYFSIKYVQENTLIYFEGGKAAASLQMLPGTIRFYGIEIPYYYMSGLCTLPEYRKKGYMAELIPKAHELMKERKIPLAILIPAEDWLYDFYRRYDYERVFEADDEPVISLQNIMEETNSLEEAYSIFDIHFRVKDFCVQKTFEEFRAMVVDAEIDGFPIKTNLSAMARITDLDQILKIYEAKSKLSNSIFDLRDLDPRLLVRLVFGYKISELGETYTHHLLEHKPIINYMLE